MNDKLRAALEKIARWHGEFPPAGDTRAGSKPISYGECYGSDGERDYMREVARTALAEPQAEPTGFNKAHALALLSAASKSGDPGAISLAAQLAGAAPCGACGFIVAGAAQSEPQPVEVPCSRCHFPDGCKAHGSCRINYDAAHQDAAEPQAEPSARGAETVTVPEWKLRRAADVLERDGDEHGVAADIRSMLDGDRDALHKQKG